MLLWECDRSVFKSIMWFFSIPFSAIKHLNPKKLQKLTMVWKVEQVLSGTCRNFKDRNHVMLKKLSDGESQGDEKTRVLLLFFHLQRDLLKSEKKETRVGGVTWLYDQWVSASSKHGVPRSWALAPSALNEELEQIARDHTFSSLAVFTVASKEADFCF